MKQISATFGRHKGIGNEERPEWHHRPSGILCINQGLDKPFSLTLNPRLSPQSPLKNPANSRRSLQGPVEKALSNRRCSGWPREELEWLISVFSCLGIPRSPDRV